MVFYSFLPIVDRPVPGRGAVADPDPRPHVLPDAAVPAARDHRRRDGGGVDLGLRRRRTAQHRAAGDRARRAGPVAGLAGRLQHGAAGRRGVRDVGAVRLLPDPVPRGGDEDPVEPVRSGAGRRRERDPRVLRGHAAGAALRAAGGAGAVGHRHARHVRRDLRDDERRAGHRDHGPRLPRLASDVPDRARSDRPPRSGSC